MARFVRSLPPRSRLLRKPSIWWTPTTGPGSPATTNVQAGWLDEPSQRENANYQFSDTTTPWPLPLVPAPGGRPGLAVQVAVPANYIRVEQEPLHTDFGNGDGPFYFGTGFFLGPNYPLADTSGAFQVIEQMRQADTGGSPGVAFEARGNRLRISGGYGVTGAPSPTAWAYDQPLATIALQQWNALVYQLNFSSTAGGSTISVWLNGTPVLSGFTVPPPTVVAGSGNGRTYRKQGIYHDPSLPAAALYIAGGGFGPTYQSVDPTVALTVPARAGQLLL